MFVKKRYVRGVVVAKCLTKCTLSIIYFVPSPEIEEGCGRFIMNYYVIGRSYTCLVTEYDAEISSLGLYDYEDFRWFYAYIDLYHRLMCFFKSGRPFALCARKQHMEIRACECQF